MSRRGSTRRLSNGSDGSVGLGPPVPIELPRVAHLLNQPEVEIGDDEFIAVAAADREYLPARVAEVALPVELADIPGRFDADAIDRADEIAVRYRVCRLLEFPQVLGKARHGRRRVEHDFGTVETEDPRAFGEMAVVADVNAPPPPGRPP